jgi:hypothetical protein
MDEFERDLRAIFDELASDDAATDALVTRTRRRARTLRRQRLAVAATAAVGIVIAVASVAAALTDTDRVRTVAPEATSTTTASTTPQSTTTASTSPTSTPTTTDQVPSGNPQTPPPPPPDTSANTTPTTGVLGNCADEPIPTEFRHTITYTQLDNGAIHVVIPVPPFGPAREFYSFTLDTGETQEGWIERTYTPSEFGTHTMIWYPVFRTQRGCLLISEFTVGPEMLPTTTTTATTP